MSALDMLSPLARELRAQPAQSRLETGYRNRIALWGLRHRRAADLYVGICPTSDRYNGAVVSAASARSEFLAGMRAELPILLGVVPFGLIYGVLAIGAGL